jgi:hypothetical protein
VRLDFWRKRPNELGFRRDAQRVLDRASTNAGPVGIDSVDLLGAMLDEAKVVRILNEIAGGTEAIRKAIGSHARAPDGGPGFTLDGKAAIEASTRRALAREENATIDDLLVGLAAADCEAHRILSRNGITAQALEA